MVVQMVGFRFKTDQMIRLAKSITGNDVTNVQDAWGNIFLGFEDHPDRYVLHLVSARPEPSHFEDVNIIFVIFANYKHKPMPYSVCRRLPRFAQATEYLRTHGITDVDEVKLTVRLYV